MLFKREFNLRKEEKRRETKNTIGKQNKPELRMCGVGTEKINNSMKQKWNV